MLMKKSLLSLVIGLLSLQLSAQANLGASATYGTDLNQWGAQVQLGYQFRHWGVRVAYATFFEEQIAMQPSVINIDFNYEVPWDLVLVPYVFTGIHLFKTEIQEASDLISYGTYGGLNLGVGGFLDLNSLQPFTEFKYVTGTTGQWFVNAGMRYQLPF